MNLAARPGADKVTWVVCMLAFLAPLLVVLQPLLPGPIESAVLWSHWLVAPVLVLVMRPGVVSWPPLLALAALITATSYGIVSRQAKEFAYVALPLLWSVVAYRFGADLACRPGLETLWRSLVLGVTALNLVTLGYLALTAAGVIDLATLFKLVQRDEAFGLERFALGNPIMVPLMMTALLHAGLACGDRSRLAPMAVTLNLVTALLSQSRLVVLIALLLFLCEFARARVAWQLLAATAAAAAVAATWDLIAPVLESLVSRFEGEDDGSGEDRRRIVGLVFDQVRLQTLLIGDGLAGGLQVMSRAIGESRSLESVALQLLVEVGIVGTGLVASAMFWGVPRRRWHLDRTSLMTALLWVQMLFLVPVFGTMSFVFFALGAAGRATADPPARRVSMPVLTAAAQHAR